MTLTHSSIFIDRLRLYAFHGVMPQERRVGAWFIVCVRVHYSILRAMESDDVAATISYADVCQLVRQQMETPSALLEHVGGRIAEAIFRRFPQTEALDVTLTKENPPMGEQMSGAGVELHLINDKTAS